MEVQKLRDEIPVLQNLTYMNTGWSGPPPRRAAQAMQERVALEMEQGPTTPGVYESGREIQEEARRAAARLLGADVDETLVTRNTTEGLNIVLSGLDWKEGDEILTCNLEHGSVLAPSWHIAHRYGANVRVLDIDPRDSHDAIVSKFEAALTDRTRLIFVSHIEYSTGLRMPAADLSRIAHEGGARSCLTAPRPEAISRWTSMETDSTTTPSPARSGCWAMRGLAPSTSAVSSLITCTRPHRGPRVIQEGEPGEPGSYRLNTSSMDKFLGGSGSVPCRQPSLRPQSSLRAWEWPKSRPGTCLWPTGSRRSLPRYPPLASCLR